MCGIERYKIKKCKVYYCKKYLIMNTCDTKIYIKVKEKIVQNIRYNF